MNLYTEFLTLIPINPLRIGVVTAIHVDGTSAVVYPDGGTENVIGVTVPVNGSAYVQGGAIVGAAPSLPTYEILV